MALSMLNDTRLMVIRVVFGAVLLTLVPAEHALIPRGVLATRDVDRLTWVGNLDIQVAQQRSEQIAVQGARRREYLHGTLFQQLPCIRSARWIASRRYETSNCATSDKRKLLHAYDDPAVGDKGTINREVTDPTPADLELERCAFSLP